jgi:hypothetical protein
MSKYLNDDWTPDISGLGYENLRDSLASLIVDCTPPFSIAVYGGWGSGKTSLLRSTMNVLGGDLQEISQEEGVTSYVPKINPRTQKFWDSVKVPKNNREKIRTVWFNPWHHQFESHPMIALLHEIRNQMSWHIKVRSRTAKSTYLAAKAGIRFTEDLIATATKLVSGHAAKFHVEKIERDAKEYEINQYQSTLDSQRFRLHFEKAIAHLVSKSKKASEDGRLVVFVDDLDRCDSSRVRHLLQSIHPFLATSRCVFVFALDQEHTEGSLINDGISPKKARDYLEKLFQMVYHLPRSRRVSLFIKECIQDLNEVDDPFSGSLEHACDVLSIILEANPRRIKNFLNQLFFRARQVAKKHSKQVELLPFALLTALRHYYPGIYRLLEEEPSSFDIIKTAMRKPSQQYAESGIERYIIKSTQLPHYGNREINDTGELAYNNLYEDHPADHNALFVVLGHFKEHLHDLEITESDLKRYLEP